MADFVYLIRNGDLHNIGCTTNLEQQKQLLKADEVVAVLKTERSEEIKSALQSRFIEARLPQSNYFRLTRQQTTECKDTLLNAGGKEDIKPFFSGLTLIFTFLLAWIAISAIIIKFALEPILNRFI